MFAWGILKKILTLQTQVSGTFFKEHVRMVNMVVVEVPPIETRKSLKYDRF